MSTKKLESKDPVPNSNQVNYWWPLKSPLLEDPTRNWKLRPFQVFQEKWPKSHKLSGSKKMRIIQPTLLRPKYTSGSKQMQNNSANTSQAEKCPVQTNANHSTNSSEAKKNVRSQTNAKIILPTVLRPKGNATIIQPTADSSQVQKDVRFKQMRIIQPTVLRPTKKSGSKQMRIIQPTVLMSGEKEKNNGPGNNDEKKKKKKSEGSLLLLGVPLAPKPSGPRSPAPRRAGSSSGPGRGRGGTGTRMGAGLFGGNPPPFLGGFKRGALCFCWWRQRPCWVVLRAICGFKALFGGFKGGNKKDTLCAEPGTTSIFRQT